MWQRPSRRRDFNNHLIAGHCSHSVVEDLEAIKIEQDHRVVKCKVALRLSKATLQAIEKEPAIGQTGHRVVQRVMGELFFGMLAVGNVAVNNDQLLYLFFVIADGAGG